MKWETPVLCEVCVGMEVTSYQSADDSEFHRQRDLIRSERQKERPRPFARSRCERAGGVGRSDRPCPGSSPLGQ